MHAPTHIFSIRLVVFIILLTLPLSGWADDTSCLECHDDVEQMINEAYYVHEPVRDKKCQVCHAKTIVEAPVVVEQPQQQSSYIIAYKQPRAEQQQPIKWLVENFTPASHQYALLLERSLRDNLILDLWYEQGGKRTHQMPTPALDSLEVQEPAYQMLSIDDLHLNNFDTRLVSRATLHWTTNEPSRCTTSYGNNSPDTLFEEDDLYTYDHKIELRNFTEVGYVVDITCRDPYRRVKTTETFNILNLPINDRETPLKSANEEKFALKQLQGKLWVEVITPDPASLSVGVQDNPEGQTIEEPVIPQTNADTPSVADNTTEEDEHIVLNDELYTTTQVCHKCHTGLEPGQSHPVNVMPPLNMTIPPEYKRLRNGKISCMSCHTVHGGNEEYRLIKKSKKALCIGCHTNY